MRGEGRTGLGGGQDRQRARGSEGKHKTVQAEGTWEEGEEAKKRELGLERGTDSPESWRRRAPRGAGGAERSARRAGAGKPPSRRPGGLGVALKFGAGGPRSKKANVGRGRARHVGDTVAE